MRERDTGQRVRTPDHGSGRVVGSGRVLVPAQAIGASLDGTWMTVSAVLLADGEVRWYADASLQSLDSAPGSARTQSAVDATTDADSSTFWG